MDITEVPVLDHAEENVVESNEVETHESVQQTSEHESQEAHATTATSQDIMFGVLAQIINLIIFFILFKVLVGNKVSTAFAKRKELISKLKNADEEYQKKIQEAQEESQKIMEDALINKKSIVDEAKQLAKKEEEKIISGAEKKAEIIKQNAELEAQNLKKQLEENFEDGVKQTAKVVVKKLIDKDTKLEDKYLDTILSDLKK